jgi:hypothetical protein
VPVRSDVTVVLMSILSVTHCRPSTNMRFVFLLLNCSIAAAFQCHRTNANLPLHAHHLKLAAKNDSNNVINNVDDFDVVGGDVVNRRSFLGSLNAAMAALTVSPLLARPGIVLADDSAGEFAQQSSFM